MLAAKTPIMPQTHHQTPEAKRVPLQPKNIFNPLEPTIKLPKPNKLDKNHVPISRFSSSNKENNPVLGLALPIDIDASLAEELTAVRKKLERLRLDRERTDKMLLERTRLLDLQMGQLEQNGELQKDLEIEVDRLYRLKQLQVACMRKSPIRSLREREMEKKSKDGQSEGHTVEEVKQELSDESSSITDSPMTSSGSKSVSTCASTSSSVTSTLRRTSPIPLRLSLESDADK